MFFCHVFNEAEDSRGVTHDSGQLEMFTVNVELEWNATLKSEKSRFGRCIPLSKKNPTLPSVFYLF
jgi:hypothetical protein